MTLSQKESDSPENDEHNFAYQIDVTDIDSFIKENPVNKLDLIVITVPGVLEHLIISCAKETIRKFQPQISVSVVEENLKNFLSLLNSLGDYKEIPSPFKQKHGLRSIRIFSSK